MRIEMVLYHGFVATGQMAIADDVDGPWTAISLPSPMAVVDALAYWQDAFNALLTPEVATFSYADGIVTLECTSIVWFLMSPTLADLLGFNGPIQEAGETSQLTPKGIADLPIGLTFPAEVEQAELEERRAGRASSLHYGRVSEVTVDVVMTADVFADLDGSPMVSGHAAFRLTASNTDEFGEDDFDGSLTLYPIDTPTDQNDGPEDAVMRSFRCTRLDEGVSLPTLRDTAWARLWGARRYGYGSHFLARIEGDETLHMEYVGDATAPTYYSLDDALVIDQSSRVGPALDEKTYFSKALDLELRLAASATTDALFAAPTKFAYLTADIDADDDAWPVDTTAGWGTSNLHIGTSQERWGGSLSDHFVHVDRGRFGRLRSYKAGAVITDKPVIWEGRRVDLFVVSLDPMGRYIEDNSDLGSESIGDIHILTSAVAMAGFYVQSRPIRDGTDWVIQCRDQVRRLTQPLGVAAGGTASWSFDDDHLLVVDLGMVLSLTIEGDSPFTTEEIQGRPFDANDPLTGSPYTSPLYGSQIRRAVADFIDAERGTSGAMWLQSYRDDTGIRRQWQLYVPVDISDVGINFIKTRIAVTGATGFILTRPFNGVFISAGFHTGGFSTGVLSLGCNLVMGTTVERAALSVTLDSGDPADLPQDGFVLVEAAGGTQILRYTSLQVDAVDAALVHLMLDTNSEFTGNDVQQLAAQDRTGDLASVSVKFYWLDTGSVPDILRRAIASTGDAVNGSYDTLPKGQGVGLPDVDEDSFDTVFDGAFLDLSATLASEAGTNLQELFSGLLRLSQRGLTTRRSTDGAVVNIAAVNVGPPDGVPVLTLTDHSLVASQGRRPVRVLDVYAAPSSIAVKCRTVSIGDQASADAVINLRDKALVDWSAIFWDLNTYGIQRATLLAAAKAWATGWFRGGYNRQVVELDVGPHHDAQPGDIVYLDGITDPSLWDYANGRPGYTGLARVLTSPMSLTTHVQTFGVALGGPLSPGPMCPSIEIVAVGDSFAFYRSDGASGSYADASTNVAARAVFAGAGVPVCTVVFWARNTGSGIFAVGDAADSLPLLEGYTAGELDWDISDVSAIVVGGYAAANPADSSWHAFAVVLDGTNAEVFGDGVSDIGPLAIAGTYAASDALHLFDFLSGTGLSGGDIRAFAVFDRALSSTEISALYTAGPAHDLTTTTGAYSSADPVVLWDQADVAGVVANRGSGGTCDLTFHGGVTSETEAGPVTSIDVDEKWYDVLVYAKGAASTWKLLAYLPGQDSGRAVYTVTDVGAPSGGLCRVTVTVEPSSPAVTLTTAHRFTWVIVPDGTDAQNVYLHTSQRRQWS